MYTSDLLAHMEPPIRNTVLDKMRGLFSNVFWKPTFNVLKAICSIWSDIYCQFESAFFFLFKNRISSGELFVYLHIQSVEKKMFLKMSTLFHLWLELRVKQMLQRGGPCHQISFSHLKKYSNVYINNYGMRQNMKNTQSLVQAIKGQRTEVALQFGNEGRLHEGGSLKGQIDF